jgi:hypothetical protein
MPEPDAEVRDLVARVRQYIRTRAHAADTVKGIASAWLGLRGEDAWATAMEQALDHLCTTGEMERQCFADGTVVYSVAARGATGGGTLDRRSMERD